MIHKQPTVCCIGLGTIGLPSACFIANSGYRVCGVDSNLTLIAQLQQGKVPTDEPRVAEFFAKVFPRHLLLGTTPIAADVYLLTVPITLNKDHTPNTTQLFAAIETIMPLLKAGNLVIIESTCPVGTVRAIIDRITATVQGVLVAYCPERIMPGNIIDELAHNTRLVGTDDPETHRLATNFYRSFVRGEIVACSIQEAEAVKLLENVYRDVNIAFANELSMAAGRHHLDPYRLIELANRHPRVNILQPGVGVGGACLRDNSWFLITTSPVSWPLTTAARKINTAKTSWVIEQITTYMTTHNLRRMACFGATYKANVADTRQSPALEIIRKLQETYEVCIVDPYLPDAKNMQEAILRTEVMIGLVPHDAFKRIPKQNYVGRHQLDFAGVFV